MLRKRWSVAVVFVVLVMGAKAVPAAVTVGRSPGAVLWREPEDIATRNLYYGPGGEKDQPQGPYTFVEEDMNGTNPKFVVLDRNKVKWTVKLGIEARPETAATRLVWAAGYFANEDYFLNDLQVQNMPAHLKRGSKLVGPGGVVHAVRLKRHLADEKSLQDWQWRDDQFSGTREWNGLKVMMALINNWDLKDANNDVYGSKNSAEKEYVVSDLGASFGSGSLSFPFHRSKGDLKSYSRSKFITKITPQYVDFRTPGRPSFFYAFEITAFVKRTRLDHLLHHVPRDDARWIGQILSGLSPGQIQDAFRAAGYDRAETDAFSQIVNQRIAELNRL